MTSFKNALKNKIDWKIFSILLISSVAAALMALPYTVSLSPVLSKLFSPMLVVAAFFQSIVIFSIVIFFGLLLAKRVGFRLPVLEAWRRGEKAGTYLKPILGVSIGMGILSGVAIILLSLLFPGLSIDFLRAEVAVGAWKGLLASFYGGIGEEILFRLFVVTLFVWIFTKIKRSPMGQSSGVMVWTAIISSSILFGLGHLGITSDLTAVTPVVVLRAVLLNGVPGVIFGWLYWKKGLEAAIIAHFSADIVIHVITPLIASLFI